MGSQFVSELTNLLNVYADGSALEGVAMKAAMVI